MKKPLVPIPAGRWIVPGTPAFELFFSELAWRFNTRTMSEARVHQLAELQMRGIAGGIASRYGRSDAATVDDLVQDIQIRVAEMDAASRYQPEMGDPLAYLFGIAEMVGMEKFVRRQPPRPASLDVALEPAVKGEQHRRTRMRRAMVRRFRQHLTPGEQRALEAEFGPMFGKQPATRRPRRPNDRRVLERAVETLRRIHAHRKGQ